MKHIFLTTAFLGIILSVKAQKVEQFTTTEPLPWQETISSLAKRAKQDPVIVLNGQEKGFEFRAWGTCFNELDLDAIRMLEEDARQEVMQRLFAPDGDLKFTRGRLTMNANDYSREWYSCDTVDGDFQLRYFNIEHDKQNVIQLIKMAQRYQPNLTFWVSPWSPPAWMKINHDYCVMSSQWNTQPKEKDYLLFDGMGEIDETEVMNAGQQNGLFPRRLAVQNYLIQDHRYMQAYADMFCKFIDLYAQEDIPVDMVMYQNEAYSYTPYPGCPWTADGTIRFNRDYLVPTMRKKHPEVEVYAGTFNTNRWDYVQRIMDGLKDHVTGMGMQWEGREILSQIRERYTSLHLISSESECGNGSMDWRAGEHTFHLLCDYIGNGCDEYFIWNFILKDNGQSPWGWRQNALIQVDSKTKTHRYTAEFYAVKHFSNMVPSGSKVLSYVARNETKGMPVIAFMRPDNKYVIVVGNFNDEKRETSIQIRNKFLNISLIPHSFNTFLIGE